MKWFTTKLGAFVAVLLLPSVASAGPFCWNETGGTTLVLSLAASDGSRFSLYGYRDIAPLTCLGNTKLPVTAEATVQGDFVLVGMQVHAVDPGFCVSSRRLVMLSLSTLSGNGSFRNDTGIEGSIALAFTSTCPPGTEPAGPPEATQDIENRVKR